MTDIASLATKIEAAKIAGNGITLNADELTGFLQIAALLGGVPVITNDMSAGGPARDDDECVTIEEVCSILKITRQTLYRWRRDGKFNLQPVNSNGNRWLRSELSDWLRQRQV